MSQSPNSDRVGLHPILNQQVNTPLQSPHTDSDDVRMIIDFLRAYHTTPMLWANRHLNHGRETAKSLLFAGSLAGQRARITERYISHVSALTVTNGSGRTGRWAHTASRHTHRARGPWDGRTSKEP